MEKVKEEIAKEFDKWVTPLKILKVVEDLGGKATGEEIYGKLSEDFVEEGFRKLQKKGLIESYHDKVGVEHFRTTEKGENELKTSKGRVHERGNG